ncbi:AvrD family protein [Kitasatospora sp. NPDC001664]|uniref:AvrD family protein n=1 Tax=Kitasatospora albolonga TaxID=68173 RepID=UPI0031EE888A
MPGTAVHLDSVDDYLGPAEKRFFGAGFRRVEYDYQPVSVRSLADGSVMLHTLLGVAYPADWSRKGRSADLRPHLSTVDGLITAVQLSELTLTHSFGLSAADRRRMLVRSVRIKAGTTPDEELGRLQVTTRLLTSVTDPAALNGQSSVLETRLGGMRVRCEIDHAAVGRPLGRSVGRARYAGPDSLLGPAEERYYGTGFARQAHALRRVLVEPERLRAEAGVHIARAGLVADQGIEGRYQPFLGMVDSFVVSLQLGQVLLYELDGTERGASNTLWMRGTEIVAAPVPQVCSDGAAAVTRLENAQLLERPDGVWRTADVVGVLGGVTTRCSVTHRLP